AALECVTTSALGDKRCGAVACYRREIRKRLSARAGFVERLPNFTTPAHNLFSSVERVDENHVLG
ncbi:hypothetical protein, partial [Spongiibacter pelagi]|uniref:hypothetical protein n=1 Tax=Spongiibacter pelagi TaxID=2760804 RepID=UPI001CC236CD